MPPKRRIALVLCAAWLGFGSGFGQTGSVTPPSSTATSPRPTPTPTEKQRLASLSEEERAWLQSYVAPIILPAEKKVFLELTEPYEREAFQEQFWQRRERDGQLQPLGPGYRHRYADLRELADSVYDRWPNDAASMVIRYGEPADVRPVEGCARTFVDGLEIWTYNHPSALGFQTRRYLFHRRSLGEPRRLWVMGTPASQIFLPNSCRQNYPELIDDCRYNKYDKCFGPVCDGACEVFKVWTDTTSRQGSVAGGELERGHLLAPEEISLEGLDSVKLHSPSWSDPKAAKIGVEGPARKPTVAVEAESEPHHELSREEILQRIGRLEPKYRKFLDTAAPLMTEHEVSEFLQLSPAEKDRLMGAFWKRRS